MKMKLIKISAILGATLGLAACETTPTMVDGVAILTELGKPAAPLPAAPAPAEDKQGYKWVFSKDGEEQSAEVILAEADSITVQQSVGCKYTDPLSKNNLRDLVPSVAWENCTNGGAGYAEVNIDGELFPLALGNKVVYTVKGTSTAGNWTGDWSQRRVCKVDDQVRIQTLAGEFDTWKIMCKDKNNKRTYYYSPDQERIVALKRKNPNNKSRNYISVFLREG